MAKRPLRHTQHIVPVTVPLSPAPELSRMRGEEKQRDGEKEEKDEKKKSFISPPPGTRNRRDTVDPRGGINFRSRGCEKR